MLFRFLATGVLAVVVGPVAARAGNPCISDAKQQYRECRAQCTEDFQVARDNCLNRDHECVELCRAERSDCHDATGIDAEIRACNLAARDARGDCRTAHPEGPARDQCIDQAQLIAFQCRDAAREQARPALKACRKQFRRCAIACPPPDPPSEATDPVACGRQAKAARKACAAACREELQFQRDACLNRDHACVEQCRSDRETCREPIETQLDTDHAACRSEREQAVANCHTLFDEGTAEFDQCVDNAQLAAFRCRDQAHENARPGFQSCRQGFRACAEACPPAS
jgi:hypothetical protein